jgi:hypothetical protein
VAGSKPRPRFGASLVGVDQYRSWAPVRSAPKAAIQRPGLSSEPAEWLAVFGARWAGDRTRTHTPLGDTPELEKKDRRKPATIGDVPTSLSLRRRRILPLHFLLTREYANDA